MTGRSQFAMDIESTGISVEEFLGLLGKRMPRFNQTINDMETGRVLRQKLLLTVNGEPCIDPTAMIRDGDQVQILTPVTGG